MANHKLYIDEFDEVDYELIAIHTSLESYRLAYFLNQKLPILLSRDKDEIQIKLKEGEVHFTRYLYENKEENTNWNLIENKNPNTNKNTLFTIWVLSPSFGRKPAKTEEKLKYTFFVPVLSPSEF